MFRRNVLFPSSGLNLKMDTVCFVWFVTKVDNRRSSYTDTHNNAKHSDTGISHFDTGILRLDTGISLFHTGISRLDTGISHFDTGISRLYTAISHLDTGISRLDFGISHLYTGMSHFLHYILTAHIIFTPRAM
jgi:uncharacterized phage infection (PIP) family protein YhgE